MEPIIIETLDSLKEYTPRLKEASESIAESLQSGDQNKSVQQLPQFFEGIQWVVSAINGLKQNGYDLSVDTLYLNEFLKEIEEAIINQDYVLLADLLEYEISPILEAWIEKIDTFVE